MTTTTQTRQTLDRYGLPAQFKVRAYLGAYDCLVIKPVSGQWIRPLAEDQHDGSHEIFLQSEDDIEMFIQQVVPPRYRKSLRDGYTVQFFMDSWTYRHYLGGQSD